MDLYGALAICCVVLLSMYFLRPKVLELPKGQFQPPRLCALCLSKQQDLLKLRSNVETVEEWQALTKMDQFQCCSLCQSRVNSHLKSWKQLFSSESSTLVFQHFSIDKKGFVLSWASFRQTAGFFSVLSSILALSFHSISAYKFDKEVPTAIVSFINSFRTAFVYQIIYWSLVVLLFTNFVYFTILLLWSKYLIRETKTSLKQIAIDAAFLYLLLLMATHRQDHISATAMTFFIFTVSNSSFDHILFVLLLAYFVFNFSDFITGKNRESSNEWLFKAYNKQEQQPNSLPYIQPILSTKEADQLVPMPATTPMNTNDEDNMEIENEQYYNNSEIKSWVCSDGTQPDQFVCNYSSFHGLARDLNNALREIGD